MLKFIKITLVSLCLLGINHTYAETFIIPDGDVEALRNAMATATDNDELVDTIRLATNGLYILTDVYALTTFNNRGSVGLPVLDREMEGGGDLFVIEGNGSKIMRAEGAPAFRILLIGQEIESAYQRFDF